MSVTPKLGLTLLIEDQNGAEIIVNEALLAFDTLVGGGTLTEATAPPGSPTNGTLRLVIATATGAFTGEEGNVALYWDGAWKFFPLPLPKHWSTTEVNTGIIRDGSPVYRKIVSLGSGVSASSKSVAHGITGLVLTKPIKVIGYVSNGTVSQCGSCWFNALSFSEFWSLEVNATNVVWYINHDMTGFAGYVEIEYNRS